MSDSAKVPYAQLRDRRRQNLAPHLPLDAPMALNIETTNRCNFRCRMWPVSFDDYAEQVGGITTLSTERIEALFDEIADWSPLKVLRFHNEGEPFVNKDLARLVRAANDRGIAERTEVTTNASAITDKAARAIIEAGLSYLRVSIYGATAKRQAFVTQSRVTADKIQSNVQRFRQLRDEMGKSEPLIYVKMIDAFDEAENEALRNRYEGIADEIEIEKPMDWNSFEGRDLLNAVYDTALPKAPSNKRAVCPYPFYSLVVKANGDVVACCVDWNKKTKVGNVLEQTLKEVWQGQALRDLKKMHLERRRHENPSCKNCTFFYEVPDDFDVIEPKDFDRVLG